MNPLITAYGVLLVAIAAEVVGTSLLASSQQFTRLWPSLGTIAAYALAFYLLSFALRVMPVGIAYAIWSGLGIVLVSAVGFVVLRQSLDLPALVGIGFIITGVIIINTLSNSVSH